MAAATAETLRDQFSRSALINKPQIVAFVYEYVAVGALQRRAGDDDGRGFFRITIDGVRDGAQPGQASCGGQGNSGLHLLDVGAGMIVVAVLLNEAGARSERLRDGGLARAGHTHHDDDFDVRLVCHQASRGSGSAALSIIHQVSPRADCARAAGKSSPANTRERIARLSCPEASSSISRHCARQGSVRLTRGTKGATWAFGTPVTQRSASVVAGLPGSNDAVRPSGP